jgi:phosphohistidine phosphatase
MDLYVVRHGVAEEPTPGGHDADRELTPDGVRKVKRAVRGMRALDLRFGRVLTSPWRRALHTAELLGSLVDEAKPLQTELLCQTPRAELLAHISEATAGSQRGTAVVGHEPWLGELVAWLAFGDARFGEALDLKKAGLVWLSGSAVPGGMMIRAILPPKLLRAVRD